MNICMKHQRDYQDSKKRSIEKWFAKVRWQYKYIVADFSFERFATKKQSIEKKIFNTLFFV